MALQIWQRLVALFLVICSCLCLFAPYRFGALAQDSQQSLDQDVVPPDYSPDEDARNQYWTDGGNDIVHEIWAILREYEPTWKDSVISNRPSGLLETAWYYLKATFRILFMNSPTRQNDTDRASGIKGDLKKAVESLQTAAAFDDPDAIFLLAELNFYGNFSLPRDFKEAFKWYSNLAELDGNSTAQYMLGLMYSTGVGGAVEVDQAKSLLYHSFAAEQGEVRSELTLAFRHHSGIGVPRNCNKAAEYYKRVADKAIAYWASGPPGGNMLRKNAYRWVEEHGGAYGEGASVSSAGSLASSASSAYTSIDNLLEYLDLRERDGDYSAILTSGRHFYEPPRGYKQNLRMAQRQFMKIARLYWTKDGKVNPKGPKGIDKIAAKAAAYIGRMFLRGEGMEQNFEKAQTWFKRGLTNGDAFAQFHLGLMYRDGLGVPRDHLRAANYFNAAAEQSLAVAQSALGVMFLDQGDTDTAARYFELAAGIGMTESFYYLAELTNKGIGRERNCGLATAYYKIVAEKAEIIHTPFLEANYAYERGNLDRAFTASLIAAEHGYENAQANVAYLLDQQTSVLSLPSMSFLPGALGVSKRSNLLRDPSLALTYYTRSAKQSNVDSLIKMGDYYISGTNQAQASMKELEKAATCYTTAAEGHHSAQALWNLGWMHENGIGSVTQDFHMAKRYYDLALEMNKEAYLPVKLALGKLRLRSWWNGISGGTINSIHDDEEESAEKARRPKTFMEWLGRFLDAAEEMDAQEAAAYRDGGDELNLDAAAYGGEPGMPGGDADHFYEGDYYGDFDDGLVESLIIVALAGALAMLVYARQQRQREVRERERREIEAGGAGAGQDQGQQQQRGQDLANPGGLFPPPGDPDFNNWVAGGIGH